MATEETNDLPAPSLPQYPELIMGAIEALNEKDGSSKTSISKHIEATYGELPTAHSTLLTHHLDKMKQAGQVVFMKNNYMKPDPDAPPRRGRGRPPKPKEPPVPGAILEPPRPRGRPPKPRDPLAPPPKPMKSSAGSGRPRGRPRKVPNASQGTTTADGERRGRGRPPKPKPAPVAC